MALGALGVVVGIAAGALVDRYGPVMGAVASGSLPVGAVRAPGADLAVATAAWEAPSSAAAEHDVTPAAHIAKDAASAASLPVPPFILARARREAALPAAPPASRARAARRRSGESRSQEHEPRASDEPILNDAAARNDAGPSEGTAASRRPSRVGPAADRLVAVKDAQAVLVPDALSGRPKLVQVGERLPSGAVLVSADPVAGRARTDRGVLDLQ